MAMVSAAMVSSSDLQELALADGSRGLLVEPVEELLEVPLEGVRAGAHDAGGDVGVEPGRIAGALRVLVVQADEVAELVGADGGGHAARPLPPGVGVPPVRRAPGPGLVGASVQVHLLAVPAPPDDLDPDGEGAAALQGVAVAGVAALAVLAVHLPLVVPDLLDLLLPGPLVLVGAGGAALQVEVDPPPHVELSAPDLAL